MPASAGKKQETSGGSRFIIRIWEGRNLAPKDINGSSDPYCIYGFVDAKGKWIRNKDNVTEPQKSLTVEKCLHPKWLTKDKIFEFPSDMNSKFRIEVWDRDKLSKDDFMGLIEIVPTDIEDGKSMEGWYTLEPRNSKDKVSGDIRISYKYQSEETIIQQKEDHDESYAKEVDNRQRKRQKTLARSNITRWIQSIESSDTPSEWMDAAIEFYEWCTNDIANIQLVQEYDFLKSFMKAVRTRAASFASPNVKFFSIVCGILGKFAESPSFHEALYQEKAQDFCFKNIKFVTPTYYRESRQMCLLLLLPYFTFFSQSGSEALSAKKELANSLIPVYSDLLSLLNEQEVNCRELVLYIVASIATLSQNLGVESLTPRIVPHIGNLLAKWPGDPQIATQVAHIFYFINHSPKSEDLLVPVSSGVMHGLKNTLHSRFPGTSFEDNEDLVKAIIPLVALFTWIGTPQSLLVLHAPKTFYILAEILRLYSQDVCVCHNVVNIFYGCLERGDTESVVSVIAKVSYHVIPVLTKNIKIYSRHKNIVVLSAKIFKTFEQNAQCKEELEKCGTLALIEDSTN